MKQIKKGICILLAVLMCFATSLPVLAEELKPEPRETAEQTTQQAGTVPDVPAQSYILLETQTGKVLAEQNADVQSPPASITKIMTLLLVMEAIEEGKISMNDTITVSTHASSMGGSQIWLKEGEQMAFTDVLKAAVVASANDASVALAEHVAGSEESFVTLMNERAKELGMTNTVFHNATGLDADGHVSTARDISIMGKELIKHKEILNYTTIWMDSLRGGATQLVNTNKLIRFYEGATGLKTGTTDGAGYCLCATAQRGSTSYLAVVMGCTTSPDRFTAARKLLDYGFANYAIFDLSKLAIEMNPVKVKHGTQREIECEAKDLSVALIPKGKEGEVGYQVELSEDVTAPVTQGQKLGTVSITMGDQVLSQHDIVARKDVGKMTFLKALEFMLETASSMNA